MLTDLKARKAEAREKDYKLADGGGPYLFVTRNGYKSWRMKYRYGGKEKRLTFGAYPEVSIFEARERRDAARRELRDHRDPMIEALKRRVSNLADREATSTPSRRSTEMQASEIYRKTGAAWPYSVASGFSMPPPVPPHYDWTTGLHNCLSHSNWPTLNCSR